MVIIRAGLLQARLGHQLDHHLVVDGDKIGGKSGVGLAEVFFIDTGGKELDPEAGLSVKLLGPQAKWAIFMVNLRAGTLTITAGQTIMLTVARL
jgi:hypothetical protein